MAFRSTALIVTSTVEHEDDNRWHTCDMGERQGIKDNGGWREDILLRYPYSYSCGLFTAHSMALAGIVSISVRGADESNNGGYAV
jgi:hypothetical protein